MTNTLRKHDFGAETVSDMRVAVAVAALLCGLCLFAVLVGAPAGLSAGLGLVAGFGLAELAAFRRAMRTQSEGRAAARSSGERIERLEDANWELREGLERYRSLVEANGDLVIRRDRNGRLTFVNEAFCQTFDIAGSDILGTAYRPQILETHGEVGRERPYDLLMSTASGRRWYSWLDILIRDDSRGLVEVQSVGRDVTARKEIEAALREARDQAEEASRAKSRFLATISHEIRTPLNGILGMAGLLSDTPQSAEQKTYATAIATSGRALMSLIDDVLDFSKIEAGKLDISPVPTDIRGLIEEVCELLAPRAHEKGIEIAGHVAPEVPETVMVDGFRLRQVLLNLAGNGLKFTDTGGVSIEIGSRTGGGEGDKFPLSIAVRDTGIGISRDAAARIFAEFEQTDPSAPANRGGTGLGLAISQRIVSLMGGRISVDSVPGRGSAFTFDLDVDAGAETPNLPSLSGRNILIVSTSTIEAPMLARTIADAGGRAEILDDVVAAEALLADSKSGIDTVLFDRRAGDGRAVTSALGAAPRTVRPIVMIVPGERDELDALKQAGFAAYLIKPVRPRSLYSILAAVLAGDTFIADPQESAPVPQPVSDTAQRHVLLAEDNEINTLLVKSVLQRLGHRTTTVADGRSAVDAVRAYLAAPGGDEAFDLVLMDLHMPVLDGLQATAEIRRLETATPDAARIPIIALTANALGEERDAALKSGLDDYITKPVDPSALAAIVAQWTEPPARRVDIRTA